MIVYRIRRKDGLYSKGGTYPSFGPKGKVWTSKGALSNHLTLVSGDYSRKAKGPYENSEIIEYYISESEVNRISVEEYSQGILERREKRENTKKNDEIKRIEEMILMKNKELESLRGRLNERAK